MSETKSELINIILAIPQTFLCNGIKSIFSPTDDIRIVEFDGFDNLADSINTHLPEILIISIGEKHSSVFDLIKTIKISNPEVSVIILLEDYKDELIYTALGLSISACLTANVGSDELITCVRKVWHGENPIFDSLTRPGIARLIVTGMESDRTGDTTDEDAIRKTLSNREREILDLVAGEYTPDQIISDLQISENDIIRHLTAIYGKLIFNNFCEFSAQTSEKTIMQGQSSVTNLINDDADPRTTDLTIPGATAERDDVIDNDDINSEYTETVWEGFEALKKELQETLEKLASSNDSPENLPEEEPEEFSVTGEESTTRIIDIVEDIPEIMPEPKKVDDFDVIDREDILESGQFSEESESPGKDNIQNFESDANTLAVFETGESGGLPPDTSEPAHDSEAEENEVPVQQKSRWFLFSRRRNTKGAVKNDRSNENNDNPDSTTAGEKPGLDSEEPPGSAKDKKIIPKRKGDAAYSELAGHTYSQGEISSSVKGIGVPVFIKTPVDAKQLEKLESIIKQTENLKIVLHKGTVQEHVLVISGREPAGLLSILNDIPIVETGLEENGIINIRLLPIADTIGLS